jgi:hypothetical protein
MLIYRTTITLPLWIQVRCCDSTPRLYTDLEDLKSLTITNVVGLSHYVVNVTPT